MYYKKAIVSLLTLIIALSGCNKAEEPRIDEAQPKAHQADNRQDPSDTKDNQEADKEAEKEVEKEKNPDGKPIDEAQQGETQQGEKTQRHTLMFAQGVSPEAGWYDVDKLRTEQDVMACWLITSSNMLQWWQDRYTEAGKVLPAGTPNGIGTGRYGLAIFDDAITKFRDLHYGANITTGLLWYISGEDAHITGHAYPRPGTGGYLRSLAGQITYSPYAFASYDTWGKRGLSREEALRLCSEALISELRKGSVIGLDIKTHVGQGGSLHAITLWGVEIDSEGQITHVYITDSDDGIHQLVRCAVDIYDNTFYQSREVALKIPASEAYPGGATWSLLRLFSLAVPMR